MITKRRNLVFRFLPGLFLSGLLLLSGCSQDDVSNVPAGSRAIDFRAQGGMSSLKATTAGSTDIHSFVVSAHYSDTWGDVSKFLLQGTTVYRGEGTAWAYSPKAYFPVEDEGDVEFFAYSPANSKHVTSSKLGSATTADQTISYRVDPPNALQGSATAQEDFLVAYENMGASEYAGDDFTGSVTLQFRHALSRVLVAAGSSLEVPVTITGLALNNLYSEGTLSLKGNISTGLAKSDGIPVSTPAGPEQNGWVYTALASIASTSDYLTLWQPSGSRNNTYPYLLPESGVSVKKFASIEESTTLALVTGADQGMFVLPQTTADLGSGDAFVLEGSYSLDGSAPVPFSVKFADIKKLPGKSVTFEAGRQYVLKLVFGSSGSGDSGVGGITIGASISFDTIGADGSSYTPDYPVLAAVPDKLPIWAQSNIYFEPDLGEDAGGSIGNLVFADETETDDDIKRYQGVYFKWGSLIGIDPTGSFGNDTYLFIPDFVSGKYIKTKVSEVETKAPAYYDAVSNTVTWGSIPRVETDFGSYVRTNDDLKACSVDDVTGFRAYKGDICRFLSGNGVSGSWRLPKSAEFGESDSDYDRDGMTNAASVPADDVNGKYVMTYYVTAQVISRNGEVTFPASGYRAYYDGNLSYVGSGGYYWSSSATNGPDAYRLYFGSGFVSPFANNTRTYGYSLKCVRE
ncbi:MAG: fimbrillin family protein [Prevotella sp.]|jgi:hypothetical protein|nr:fimbrillin family protein [Prevotella sp.]